MPEPTYGGQLQPFSIQGVPEEGRPTVTYERQAGQFWDGESYELLVPSYAVLDLGYGPFDASVRVSPRVAPAVIGLGLLEAIDEARLEALADPLDEDGDGISGRINRVWDVTQEQTVVGRFGWKAEQPTVRQQSAAAFSGDVGITTDIFATEGCTGIQTACAAAIHGGTPEFPPNLLDRVEAYGRLLAVPARQRFDDDTVLRGKRLFTDVGCARCHVPRHQTRIDADLPELRDQRIWPYTDLLLHDMGEGLTDNRPTYLADGNEWRTPPLWGLRFYEVVNGHNRLLHDGRARGVVEAIMWHGGEGDASKRRFQNLDASDRAALVAFVRSL